MNQESTNALAHQVKSLVAAAESDTEAKECLGQIRAAIESMDFVLAARREGLGCSGMGHIIDAQERAMVFAEQAGFHLIGSDTHSYFPGGPLVDPAALACLVELCQNAALADFVEMQALGLDPAEMGARVLDPAEIDLRYGRGQETKALREELGPGKVIQLFN